MKMTKTAIGLAIYCASVTALAQTPPNNNLGKSVATVVYPSIPEIVEDQIRDIEDTQLTDSQAKRIKDIYLKRERSKATPYNYVAEPVTRTLSINLDPGVTPPVLRLARGQQSSVVFSDGNGDPWFIESVAMNRQFFSDGQAQGQSGGEAKPTNLLSIEPLTPAAYGNVTVKLKGLSTPVIFVLTSGQKQVDMRVDAKIPGKNPDSVAVITNISSLPPIDTAMTYFLDGVAPKTATELTVRGLDRTRAWRYRGDLYLRTHADAQYPAYLASARSTNGLTVYRFNESHQTITLLSGGQAVTIFINQL